MTTSDDYTLPWLPPTADIADRCRQAADFMCHPDKTGRQHDRLLLEAYREINNLRDRYLTAFTIVDDLVDALRHYRTRVHTDAQDPSTDDYLEVRTWVHKSAVALADQALAAAKARHLGTGRTW